MSPTFSNMTGQWVQSQPIDTGCWMMLLIFASLVIAGIVQAIIKRKEIS